MARRSFRSGDPPPRTVHLGDRSAVVQGQHRQPWRDLSHLALTVSWPVFGLGALAAFVAFNALFGLLFAIRPDSVANVPAGSWLHYVYFSIETIATVGYGDMHPQTHYGHVVASAEMFVGIFYAAVLTGLIFNRFSKPRARILFARTMALAQVQGQPTLMIRMANERHNAITNASAKLWYIRLETSGEGTTRTFSELPLRRRESPAFLLSWTIYHPVDRESPIRGLTAADLEKLDASFAVIVDGYDESAAQFVRARYTYEGTDVAFGQRYVDIIEMPEPGLIKLDYRRFHDTEPDRLSRPGG